MRELLALQSSDWAFLVSEELAPPYGRERFDGHLDALREALIQGPEGEPAGPRNLAVDAARGDARRALSPTPSASSAAPGAA